MMQNGSMDAVHMWKLVEWRKEVETMLRGAGARLVDWCMGRPVDVGSDGGGWWKVIITARHQLTVRDVRHHLLTISDDSGALLPYQFVCAHDKACQSS